MPKTKLDLEDLIRSVSAAIDQEFRRQYARGTGINIDLAAAAAVRQLLIWLDEHPNEPNEPKATH